MDCQSRQILESQSRLKRAGPLLWTITSDKSCSWSEYATRTGSTPTTATLSAVYVRNTTQIAVAVLVEKAPAAAAVT